MYKCNSVKNKLILKEIFDAINIQTVILSKTHAVWKHYFAATLKKIFWLSSAWEWEWYFDLSQIKDERAVTLCWVHISHDSLQGVRWMASPEGMFFFDSIVRRCWWKWRGYVAPVPSQISTGALLPVTQGPRLTDSVAVWAFMSVLLPTMQVLWCWGCGCIFVCMYAYVTHKEQKLSLPVFWGVEFVNVYFVYVYVIHAGKMELFASTFS